MADEKTVGAMCLDLLMMTAACNPCRDCDLDEKDCHVSKKCALVEKKERNKILVT